VRNNYFQPAMQDLMAACVEIWESDPETFAYHGSGYIVVGDGDQEADLSAVYERQQRIGYGSDLILGESEVAAHMRSLFPDWRAAGLTVCLHENQGGFAFNKDSIYGLAAKARAAGAEIEDGVRVTGFDFDESGGVTSVQTTAGPIGVEDVTVAVGPWAARFWELLGLPRRLDVDGVEREMWTYWYLQEGEIQVDPRIFVTADGSLPPVLHVDSHAPLRDDSGRLITDGQWGVYFKQDKHSVQGGAEPLPKGHEFEIDPYPTGTVEPGFPDMWCAALSHCMERFQGSRPRYRHTRSGGVGAFTADNFPVFDYMCPNVFVAADSNHGYKMIAVGREIARMLTGEHSSLLHPFRYERFATGDLHPVSHSPYPWA
jgi:methylglutamate dehydrogenase subunit A